MASFVSERELLSGILLLSISALIKVLTFDLRMEWKPGSLRYSRKVNHTTCIDIIQRDKTVAGHNRVQFTDTGFFRMH
jgi:glycyl-tRNA synthetase beta subunit